MGATRYRLSIGPREFQLSAGDTLIGRSDGCAICLDDALISGIHAKIVTADTHVVIVDLGSSNGTHVNGTRLTDPVALKDGDTIRVGKVEMTFHKGLRARRSNRDVRTVGFEQERRRHSSSVGGDDDDVLCRMIELGRLEKAEKLLKNRVGQLAAMDPPLPVGHVMVRSALEGLLTMAEKTRDAIWIHRLFKLHVLCRWFMTEVAQQRVDQLLRVIGHLGGDGLPAYLALWSSRVAELSAPQRQQLATLQAHSTRPP